jgi:hypothetical protein
MICRIGVADMHAAFENLKMQHACAYAVECDAVQPQYIQHALRPGLQC